MRVLRHAATVGGLTLISRVLGFVRDAAMAALLGAGVVADAFFVSFKLANLLRRLFAEGAFAAGFVPLFARILTGEGAASARRFAEEVAAILGLVLLAVVAAAELAMPWLVRVLATGFDPAGPRYALAVELSRITFPYLAFISLAALLAAVLNALGRFAAAAAAPVVLNLALITALTLSAVTGLAPAPLLAWGVFAAGLVQLLLLTLALHRAGFMLRLRRPHLGPRVRRLFALVLPGAVGAGVYQLNLVVDTWFASHLEPGAVSWLFYADRLNQLPLGAVGVALGTALLPALSAALRAGKLAEVREAQNRALEVAMLLTLPAATALVVMGEPIVAALFQRGAFTAEDTAATAAALAAFALGLPAYVAIKLLAPGYFAREDTRTPVVIASICLLANVLFLLLLVDPLGHVGIALATALANGLNATLLARGLWRAGHLAPDARLYHRLGRTVLACLAMAAVLAGLETLTPNLAPVPRLVLLVAAGLVTYGAAALALGAVRPGEWRSWLGSAGRG